MSNLQEEIRIAEIKLKEAKYAANKDIVKSREKKLAALKAKLDPEPEPVPEAAPVPEPEPVPES